MSRDDARLHRMLDEERAQLLADLSYFNTMEYDHNGASNHMAEDATASYDQASDLALRLKAERRLERVERAMAKLAEGTYGYCEGCGEPIDFARLKALPDARYCLNCQRQREGAGAKKPGPRALEQGTLSRPIKRTPKEKPA